MTLRLLSSTPNLKPHNFSIQSSCLKAKTNSGGKAIKCKSTSLIPCLNHLVLYYAFKLAIESYAFTTSIYQLQCASIKQYARLCIIYNCYLLNMLAVSSHLLAQCGINKCAHERTEFMPTAYVHSICTHTHNTHNNTNTHYHTHTEHKPFAPLTCVRLFRVTVLYSFVHFRYILITKKVQLYIFNPKDFVGVVNTRMTVLCPIVGKRNLSSEYLSSYYFE